MNPKDNILINARLGLFLVIIAIGSAIFFSLMLAVNYQMFFWLVSLASLLVMSKEKAQKKAGYAYAYLFSIWFFSALSVMIGLMKLS